jgi:hypothetical protein
MHPDIVKDMAERTPAGWYGLATPKGWDNLVAECHLALKAIDPSYEIHQIKEKFGGLRYYCSLNTDEAKRLVRQAEEAAWGTCQECGVREIEANVTEKTVGVAWHVVACDACYNDLEQAREARLHQN